MIIKLFNPWSSVTAQENNASEQQERYTNSTNYCPRFKGIHDLQERSLEEDEHLVDW
jgi:hypothetical protein